MRYFDRFWRTNLTIRDNFVWAAGLGAGPKSVSESRIKSARTLCIINELVKYWLNELICGMLTYLINDLTQFWIFDVNSESLSYFLCTTPDGKRPDEGLMRPWRGDDIPSPNNIRCVFLHMRANTQRNTYRNMYFRFMESFIHY